MAFYQFKDFYILEVGERIPLIAYLWDKREDLFVTATITSDQNVVLHDKVLLTHVLAGKYQYSSPTVIFPSSNEYINIIYEVFLDAGFTTPSPLHSTNFITIQVNDIISDSVSALDDINQILQDLRKTDVDMEVLDQDDVLIEIDEGTEEVELIVDSSNT